MSTQLAETSTHWEISTIATIGREQRRPRGRVSIPKKDLEAREAEIIKQIEASRVKVGIPIK